MRNGLVATIWTSRQRSASFERSEKKPGMVTRTKKEDGEHGVDFPYVGDCTPYSKWVSATMRQAGIHRDTEQYLSESGERGGGTPHLQASHDHVTY